MFFNVNLRRRGKSAKLANLEVLEVGLKKRRVKFNCAL
jgi:hypothetical protein